MLDGFIINYGYSSTTYMAAERPAPGSQNKYYLVDLNEGVVVDHKCYKSLDTIEKRLQRLVRQRKIVSYSRVRLDFNIKSL